MADKKPQASKKKKGTGLPDVLIVVYLSLYFTDPPAGAATNARIDKSNRRQSPPRAETSTCPVRPVPVRHRRSNTSTSAAGLLQLELEAQISSLASSLNSNELNDDLTPSGTPKSESNSPMHDDLSSSKECPQDGEEACTPRAEPTQAVPPALDDDLGLDFSLSFDDYSPEFEMPESPGFSNFNTHMPLSKDSGIREFDVVDQLVLGNSTSMGFFSDVDNVWNSLSSSFGGSLENGHETRFQSASWSPRSENSLYFPFLQAPRLDPGSDEMLLRRFEEETCSIMSIRNGPVDNPWRTLVVPLVSVSPVLFHAVCAMAAFHGAKTIPELRHQGIFHFNNSLACLRQNVDSLPAETSLMTSIALAFAESWDSAISTGIDHIKAAKKLIQQSWDEIGPASPKAQVERFKFLCKTWIYIDVIARLTSVDDDVSDDFAKCAAMLAMGGEREVDPLMGCASSLFPIIGCVANLVRRVCRLETNSPAMVEQASKLKDALESWRPPPNFRHLLDPTGEVQHSLQTAEAYRWATLLYLYQAVPELPSPPSSKLGSKVMKYLATVPLNSRTIITHIYPLLAAGCEATTYEDRNWVSGRWQQMSRLMLIGNIDSCADVVKEVWRRRDQYAAMKVQDWALMEPEQHRDLRQDLDLMANLQTNDLISQGARETIMAHRDFSRPHRPDFTKTKDPDDVNGSMDREYTVRGLLHWVSVMKDWKWEGKLGLPYFCVSP